jgi:hypothetical protein
VLSAVDTIRRSFLKHDAFDYAMIVIELAVLLLIAGEIGVHAKRYFRHRRRTRRILDFLSEGQRFQQKAPSLGAGVEEMSAWIDCVKAWSEQTSSLLSRYSSEASSSFFHKSGGVYESFGYGHVAQGAQEWYITLQGRLNNLREIMEKPEVYL